MYLRWACVPRLVFCKLFLIRDIDTEYSWQAVTELDPDYSELSAGNVPLCSTHVSACLRDQNSTNQMVREHSHSNAAIRLHFDWSLLYPPKKPQGQNQTYQCRDCETLIVKNPFCKDRSIERDFLISNDFRRLEGQLRSPELVTMLRRNETLGGSCQSYC